MCTALFNDVCTNCFLSKLSGIIRFWICKVLVSSYSISDFNITQNYLKIRKMGNQNLWFYKEKSFWWVIIAIQKSKFLPFLLIEQNQRSHLGPPKVHLTHMYIFPFNCAKLLINYQVQFLTSNLKRLKKCTIQLCTYL